MKQILFWVAALTLGINASAAEIRKVSAKACYPWDGKVAIVYELVGDATENLPENEEATLVISVTEQSTGAIYVASEGALVGDAGCSAGAHRVVWDLAAQGIAIPSGEMVFSVAINPVLPRYCVIDLSAGANAANYPVSYFAEPPEGGFNTNEYKTTKLVLRRIEPGSFKMLGQYDTTLSKPFYCDLFEVTQMQYSLVMGNNPSCYKGDMRPVEQVSWNGVRGGNWPDGDKRPGGDTFVGRLQMRTGVNFDLPTEAQWEYACRAGTTSAYNNGGDTEDDLRLLGRYSGNKKDGKGGYAEHTTVGSYLPNAWGLYDMHGNVWEWCLDWYGDLSSGVTNPTGLSSGSVRVIRGGRWSYSAHDSTSSCRNYGSSVYSYYSGGFRLVRTLGVVTKTSDEKSVGLMSSQLNITAHSEVPWEEDSDSGFWRAGAIGDEEESWIETTVEGAGTLKFRWKVSSEAGDGDIYDDVAVFVDGEEKKAIGGEVDWQEEVFSVSGDGTHTIRWVYRKDESDEYEGFEGCAWLDAFSWTPEVRVSFALAEGEGEPPEMLWSAFGEVVMLPSAEGVAYAKHSFAGWSDGVVVYPAGAEFVVPEAHVTLTATWTPNLLEAPVITLSNAIGESARYLTSAEVAISAEEGATVYYTLDGSTPTAESLRYTEPLTLPTLEVCIRAIALREDYFDSAVTKACFASVAAAVGFSSSLACGGDTPWLFVTDAYEGRAAMQSGAVGEGGVSWMESTFVGEGMLTFYWRVSSYMRKKKLTDYVSVLVDGEEVAALGGLVDAWQVVEVPVMGSVTHTVRWVYQKNDDGNAEGDDCAWVANVSFERTILPDLSAEASSGEVQIAVAEFADAAVAEQVKTVETYNAFKAWVGEKNLAPQAVAEAPRAWASYVLGQPSLLPEEIPEDAVQVETFEPDAAAGDGAYALTFRLEDATLGEEAVAALLDTVFEVQGGTSPDALSGEDVETTFEIVDGKVRVYVSPKGDNPPGTFFYRIRLK